MLPKNLKYGSRVESAAAKSSRVNIATNNGTGSYSLGDTIILNIPTRNNLVLVPNESYLKFTLSPITAGAAATVLRWDSCGAHGVIQRIRIFHGSNLLQDIDNYNLLTKMLFDIQVPSDATMGKLNVLAGTRSELSCKLSTITQDKFNTVIAVNTGDVIRKGSDNAVTLTAAALTGTNNTYCLNLNCLLGTLCSQNYFPLFACTSAPLRMEITLVDAWTKALNSVTVLAVASTNVMTNVEYIANFIELGDSSMSVVANSLQGQPLQFCVPDWRNYQYTYALVSANATQVTFAIPAKFSSLKSIFVTVRDKGMGGLTFYPFSSVTNGIIDYQFRIGPNILPPKAVNTLPEMFAEVIKAMGSMSDLNYEPSINKGSYTLNASVASVTADDANGGAPYASGSFYVGIDLENYVGADKLQIYAGYNSNSDDLFFIGNFKPAADNTCRFDAFANFDSCLMFENSTCYVRY